MGSGSAAAATGSFLGGVLGTGAALVLASFLVTDICELATYGGCSLGDGYLALAITALGTGAGMVLGCWIGLHPRHRTLAPGAAAILVLLLLPAGIVSMGIAWVMMPVIGSGGTPLEIRLGFLFAVVTFWAIILGYLAHRLAMRKPSTVSEPSTTSQPTTEARSPREE